MTGQVDVVIPVHCADRDVLAAIASAEAGVQGIRTEISVVLHNYAPESVAAAELRAAPARILRCDDGVPSPSGPRNVGLDAGTAPYVLFLDSDDRLAPDCIRRLHEVAEATGADAVLPSLLRGSWYIGTPLVARRSTKKLDVVRHHLFLRSHVPALLRRSSLQALAIRYPEGMRTGEDFVVMSQLFAMGTAAMAFDAVYIVLDEAADRASTTAQSPRWQLAAERHVLTSTWIDELSADALEALIRRILAVNLAGGWRRRRYSGQNPSGDEHRLVRDLALAKCPSALRFVSVRDRVSLRFCERPGWMHNVLTRRPFGIVPSSFAGAVSRRGPVVYEARSLLARVRRRRADLSGLQATPLTHDPT